jgi:anti-anti-sigma factor
MLARVSSFELDKGESSDAGVSLVSLGGELDLTNVIDLEPRLDELMGESNSFVLDLSRVVFVDSAALHMLFRLVREHPTTVAIVISPGAPIARMLEIADLGRLVPIAASYEEARVAMRGVTR